MTYIEARDEMFAVFQAVWSQLGYYAAYQDIPATPPSDQIWARVTLRHSTGGAASLTGALGKRRFTRNGTLYIQVFTPSGDGSTAGYTTSALLTDAYEKAIGCVRYRNVRINEVGTSGAFDQINVMADFTYDEIN